MWGLAQNHAINRDAQTILGDLNQLSQIDAMMREDRDRHAIRVMEKVYASRDQFIPSWQSAIINEIATISEMHSMALKPVYECLSSGRRLRVLDQAIRYRLEYHALNPKASRGNLLNDLHEKLRGSLGFRLALRAPRLFKPSRSQIQDLALALDLLVTEYELGKIPVRETFSLLSMASKLQIADFSPKIERVITAINICLQRHPPSRNDDPRAIHTLQELELIDSRFRK